MLNNVWQELRMKGARHWTVAAILVAVGVLVGHRLSESDVWIEARYATYQKTMDAARLRGPLYPKRTVLVLIGDDTYWRGTLGARSPIKRDYVAEVIDKVVLAQPAAIAIDFDLRSPTPDGSLIEHPDYRGETEKLRQTIVRIAPTTPIIVPASVSFDANGDYFRVSSILDTPELSRLPIREGYLQLPYDKRRVPLSIDLSNGKRLDSFSQAIVGAIDPVAYRRVAEEEMNALPFISYMTEDDFKGDPVSPRILAASQVMSNDVSTFRNSVAHNVVIVSGSWSTLGSGLGPRVDMHPTPAGRQPGSLVHANFVEAMLSERTFRPIPEPIAIGAEVLAVLGIAVIFALSIPVAWKVLGAGLASTFLAFVCYVGLQNLGLFFDFFIPLIVLVAHIGIDKILEWRKISAQAEHSRASANLQVSV